jgi:hypothetical protein
MITQEEKKIEELSQQRDALIEEWDLSKIKEYWINLKKHYDTKFALLQKKDELELQNQITKNPNYYKNLEQVLWPTHQALLKELWLES